MSLARDIRTNTGHRSAHKEVHALVRKILTQPGDIDPTETRFPGTDQILPFAIEDRTRARRAPNISR